MTGSAAAEPGSPGEPTASPDAIVVRPEPTPDELAAILAAYEQLWPTETSVTAPAPSPRWRYAGRPWTRRPTWRGWT